ncbi:MAG: glycoside hydrolase family 97 N-terminal domain-containing protein [Kiritimatiellae bacterium]|nr:glycoside hydrolase family 97 N-terminal domain-containing protein [Kiritimatiellia bacterium]
MNSIKKMAILCFLSAVAFIGCNSKCEKITDGRITADFKVVDGKLMYSISFDGKEVLPTSELGVTVNGRNLGEGVKLGKSTKCSFSETYEFAGNCKTILNKYDETTWAVLDEKTGEELMKLQTRIFNDGVAYRYLLDGSKPRKITDESSSWTLPQNAKFWYQVGVGSYENKYTSSDSLSMVEGKPICLPITAKLATGEYLLFTEANLYNYSDLAVKREGNRLKGFFHSDKNGFEQTGEAYTPWRVTIVTKDLNVLANSHIVKNLCPPPSDPSLASKDFCKPGRSIWQWLPAGAPIYSEQEDWYNKTKELGFEYYLIDDGWRDWKDGDKDQWECLKTAIAYGNKIGVKTAIWVHSKEVFNAETRMPYLKRVKECGAVGIKIDFMPPSNYHWTKWYEDTSRDCAQVGLFVDFHGSVKPTGRERTWPHELAREAIRGHEWHITRYDRVLPKDHDCIVPFCRSVQGRADYTPVVFEKKELVHFTWPRELAQGIVFSAPFLCFGDRPGTYLANPMVEIFKSIPATYDETIVLPCSEIGECAAFAKCKDGVWFIAILNGENKKDVEIDLSFLGNGKYKKLSFRDAQDRLDDCVKQESTVTKSDRLKISLCSGGGYVARLIKE